MFELGRVDAISAKYNKTAKIYFGLPGIDAHTHDFIQTGQIDSKFGVALETGEAMDIVAQAAKLEKCRSGWCPLSHRVADFRPCAV